MNALFKEIKKWQKKNSDRREAGVFLIEGLKEYQEAPRERLLHVVMTEKFASDHENLRKEAEALKKEGEITFTITKEDTFSQLSDTRTPQGVLAVLKAFSYTEEEVLSEKKGLYMILENLSDPGNLGTVIRSSEAAGVSGIILSRGCVDVYNPKVIRATMGSIFRMKFAVTDDVIGTIRKIREMGGYSYAAHLMDSVEYTEPDYTEMTAFLIGNEANGLTKETADAADSYIKIPMAGKVESLNAAMAASILMFEASRQRRNSVK